MNPLLILGLAGVGLYLLGRKSEPTAVQPTAIVKLPTSNKPGSVTATLPEAPVLSPPQVVTLPEITITGNPDNKSFALTANEQLILEQGTDDAIFAEAIDSDHQSFVAAANLILAGKGDARSAQLTERLLNWPQ